MTTFVVVNPKAGGGRAQQAWPEISDRLRAAIGAYTHTLTGGVGDASQLVRDAIAKGARRVIAVGGDGTVNEVVNGFIEAGSPAGDPELAVLPVGSGVDFARGMDMASGIEAGIARLTGGQLRIIDLGRATYVSDRGRLESRTFANIASFGISGLIVRQVNAARTLPMLPAGVAYYGATLRALALFRFQRVRLTVDTRKPIEVDIAAVAVANGRYFGGGMMIAPDAQNDDGLFDIVILRGTSKAVLLRDLRLVYGGRHRAHPAITILRARRLVAEPAGGLGSTPVLLEMDGEAPGQLRSTFDVLPRALAVRC
jgi:diacylglycerol kinase (ATP)